MTKGEDQGTYFEQDQSQFLGNLNIMDKERIMDFAGRRQQLSETFDLKNRVDQEYIGFNIRGAQMRKNQTEILAMIEDLAATDQQMAEKFRKQLSTSTSNATFDDVTLIPSYE